MFISGRLPDLMFPEDESGEKFSIARESRGFKTLAKELGRQEPTLRKVTGVALWSMYTRLIKAYEKLEEVLVVETGGQFEHSRLSELVKSIFELDRDFAAKRKLASADKEQERQRALAELETINADAARNTMMTLGERRALLRRDEEETDETSAATGSTSNTSTPAAAPRSTAALRSLSTTSRGPTASGVTTGSTSTSTPSSSSMDSSVKSLSDIQQQLLLAVHATNDKYNGVVSRQNSFEAKVTAEFSDFGEMSKRIEQMMKGFKTALADLQDDIGELRREIRGIKRKHDSEVEDLIAEVQGIKKRK